MSTIGTILIIFGLSVDMVPVVGIKIALLDKAVSFFKLSVTGFGNALLIAGCVLIAIDIAIYFFKFHPIFTPKEDVVPVYNDDSPDTEQTDLQIAKIEKKQGLSK